ncbi:MAG: glycoside hydrolase family 15 protein, partial [Bacillota bacterium]|nr:glycoside hydrolase family 15 protein [Bacillota bacterium]
MPLKKPLLLDAVLGNARMLITFDRQGRVHHLFWPQIDFAQHISQLRLGLVSPALGAGVLWLEDRPWEHRQSYHPRAALLRTTITNQRLGLTVYLDDCVWPDGDILVRRLTLENSSPTTLPVGVLLYSALDIEESRRYNTVYFDWDQQALLHYRRDRWFAFGADRAAAGYQCGREQGGESAWSDCEDGLLSGRGIENGDTDGAVLWPLEEVGPGGRARLSIFLAAGHNSAEALRGLALARRKGGDRLLEEAEAHWQRWLSRARPLAGAHPAVEQLYYRSLMTLKLLSDERHGAFIAAPEFDPDRIGCGGYGYCWGRDASYIATAFDEAGCHQEARAFYRWAKRVQDPRGVWYQRYYVDGH